MPIKLLVVENSEAQAQKILQPLRQAGLAFNWERVETLEGLRAALGRGAWDLLLCEHSMPGLAYAVVLSEARPLDLPCIILSAKGDEDLVARAMRLGARDFVSMGRLARLPRAVQRELGHGRGPQGPAPDPRLLELIEEAYGLHEVILDAQGRPVDFRFVAMNPAYERFTGLRAADTLGRTVLEVRPTMDPARIEQFGRVAQSGQPTPVDDYRSIDGRTFSGLVFCPQPGQFAVLFSDLTDSRALVASKDRLAAAVEQTAEGIFISDLDGRIQYANPALERALGLGAKAAWGRPQEEVLPGLPCAGQGEAWQGRIHRTRGDGAAQLLDCTVSPVRDPSGRPTSMVGMVRDATLEAETDRSLRQMEKMKALDDTAVYRRILTEVVESCQREAEVTACPSGRLALARLEQTPADVVLLDVEMPDLSGLETLRLIRRHHPATSVVMISGTTSAAAAYTFEALALGALEFVRKPEGFDAEASRAELVDVLRPILRHIQTRKNLQGPPPGPASPASPRPAPAPHPPAQAPVAHGRQAPRPTRFDVLGIGVSTGGPNALGQVIPALPADLPVPILIVQHMPPMFTASLADHLNRASKVPVKEAVEGEEVFPGHVYLAPGGKHMVIRRMAEGEKIIIGLNENPPENSCRPSVDVLFRSMAAHYDGHILAVVMTGMGTDGCEGVRALKRRGCHCLTQSEDTCVVYGMPMAVDEAGLSDEQVALPRLAPRIAQLVGSGRTA